MKILIVLILLVVTLGSGCTEREIRLSANDRQIVDTIYLRRLDSLRPIWDTLCVTNRQKMLDAAVDSLVRTRLEEEARLRARIKQQEQ
ncbi:MAG: hypothetical protein HUU01_15990 [Saprospiraceae bacterium]|nr:hypothetical protein [Saprospiraceae bacterium]